MKSKFVIVAVALCAMIVQALAEVKEQTSKDYEASVQMSQTKQNELRALAQDIINKTYTAVIAKWNSSAGTGFAEMPAGQDKYQFQGSIGYKMALSKPDGAKSDADVAFLYKYNGGDNQPTTATLYASKLKELARDVFRPALPTSYSYEIKNPVVAINVPSTPTTDHVDMAFFNELKATASPSASQCVLPPVTAMPCSQLSWGKTQSGPDPSSWVASDRLNLTETLNREFDKRGTAEREVINRAGKIFKEWRFKQFGADEEKVPSIALVTLIYNLLQARAASAPVYVNSFVLLKDTLAKGAMDNFNNNCANQPQNFQILLITYPFNNLLMNLSTPDKQNFCNKLMAFKRAVEQATPATVPDTDAVKILQPCFPPDPCFGPCSQPPITRACGE